MPKAGATLPEALLHTAGRGAGQLTFHLEDGPVRLSVAELAERAQGAARTLAARGVAPGDPVGVLGPNRPEWAVWAWATWLAGAALVPLQIPLRVRDPQAFGEQLGFLVDAAGCRLVMSDPRLLPTVPKGVGLSWDESTSAHGADPAAPGPDDPAVIQFTSGSTAAPKGALITHRAAMAQMDCCDAWNERDLGEHVLLGWVPFFHDLGLFYYMVVPAVFGASAHYLPTERFAADPAAWLSLVGPTRATVTHFLPSASGAALRAAERRSEPFDLSGLERAVFAAESIAPDVVDRVRASATRFRLAPEALRAGYGLAEAVLGVTYTSRGGLHFDDVDLAELVASGRAVPARGGPARRLAACGDPAPGTELRIVRGGEDLLEREIGEIYVRGPSLMERYVGPDAPDPFVDGWLRTGDLGYLVDGELYVTGRLKDMVVVLGQNYYPEDFEWAAGRLSGVRAGRCVAFSDPENEQVVVLVEPSADGDPRVLSARVHDAVADSVGIAPADVLVVPRGTVEKTTSGKLRRSAMRDAYARGELRTVADAEEART